MMLLSYLLKAEESHRVEAFMGFMIFLDFFRPSNQITCVFRSNSCLGAISLLDYINVRKMENILFIKVFDEGIAGYWKIKQWVMT